MAVLTAYTLLIRELGTINPTKEISWNPRANAPTKMKSPEDQWTGGRWSEKLSVAESFRAGFQLRQMVKEATSRETTSPAFLLVFLRNTAVRKRSTSKNCAKRSCCQPQAGSWRTMALNSRDMFVDSDSPVHGEVPLFTDTDNSTVFLWWSFRMLFSMTFTNSEELYKRGYYQLKNDFALSLAGRSKREYLKALALKAD